MKCYVMTFFLTQFLINHISKFKVNKHLTIQAILPLKLAINDEPREQRACEILEVYNARSVRPSYWQLFVNVMLQENHIACSYRCVVVKCDSCVDLCGHYWPRVPGV